MITTPAITPDSESDKVYNNAIARLQEELGWTPGDAHRVLADIAAGYGVFLQDVAVMVLAAPSLKGGVPQALQGVTYDHRPLQLRPKPRF